MSAERLREAAALMRERAEATSNKGQHPWLMTETNLDADEFDVWTFIENHHWTVAVADFDKDAEHIASWHPAVALAVADWLDATADRIDAGRDPKLGGRRNHGWRGSREALAVANAYLGADS